VLHLLQVHQEPTTTSVQFQDMHCKECKAHS